MSDDSFTDEAARVREVASRVAETGRALAAFGPAHVARSLAEAVRRLADPNDRLGRRLRDALPESTGLTPPMIEWALATAVTPHDEEALSALVETSKPPPGLRAVPPRLSVCVLAGNVFTAALRAVAIPLLAGSPVVAKASSRDDVFPRLLRRALLAVDPELAPCFEVLTFPGGRTELEDALFAGADVVSVYGSDATLASIRVRLRATTRLIAHGHGLGAIFLPREALVDEANALEIARAVALDVAAYDQRGCLSPHAIWIERGAPVGGARFTELLAREGLAQLAKTLPRGALPTEAGAAQVQWRGVAAARGELFEGDGFAASWEGDAALRMSPGYRNVVVLECGGADDLARRLSPLGVHLKALGIAGEHETRHAIANALRPPLAPRVSSVGAMQTPPPGALSDGEPPFAGLLRFIEVR